MSGSDATGAVRIFVCEDEPALRADIAAVLREEGYAVSEAADGLAARNMLETNLPDLILCDISMPHLSGHDLLSHVRENCPDLAEVPFLFLTALSDREQVIAGKRAGADDYLVKPVDYEVMLATIDAHLRQVSRVRTSLVNKAQETLASLHEMESRKAYSALDSLAPAIALLDKEGRVVYANAPATDLLAASDSRLKTRLGLEIPAALQRSRTSAHEDESAFLRLPQHSEGQELIVLLSLLPVPASSTEAAVVALIVDPAQRSAPADTLLKKLFGLTPTEARVASLLAQGDRLEEIAKGLGVQQSTVVFHLRNIFVKTGTNRQTDLVALLLSLTVAQSG